MKHLQSFERFGFHLPKFNRKRIEDSEVLDMPAPKDSTIVEIPVRWTGGYEYNGEDFSLEIGDLTNKGVIIDIIEDISARYNTNSGSYAPQELTVIKGEPEDLEAYMDQQKYNL